MMMAFCLLLLFAAIALGMFMWGLVGRDRVFQFPFLAAIVWAAYLLPQAIGVFMSPRVVPKKVMMDGGLELTLLMYCLCAGMGFLGYIKEPSRQLFQRPPAQYDMDRLFWGGCFLLGLAFYGYSGLARLCGGYLAVFSADRGGYTLEWRGMSVMYTFFQNLIYPGLACCLLAVLRKPAVWKWAVVVAASALPVAIMVFMGRRSHAVRFFLICGIALFFGRHWVPPRWLLVAAIVLGSVAIIVAPQYRTHSQIGGDWSEIEKIDVGESVKGVLYEGRGGEFQSAVVIIPAYHRAGQFNYGRGFYNRIIQDLVPRMIVGDAVKESLFLRTPDQDELTSRYYGWKRKFYMVVTGPCDAFREFWFAGAFIFLLLGAVFRVLWERSANQGSVGGQIVYLAVAPLGLGAASGMVTLLAPQLVYLGAFLLPVMWFARCRRRTDSQVASYAAAARTAEAR